MLRDPEKAEARFIRECLSPTAGNVLEVGCGTGRLTADLAMVADNLVATDPFLEELRSARTCVEIPVWLVVALGELLPIAAKSIDTVVFTLSLHHQEPYKALSEARRVLKEDGQIFVLEPVADSMIAKLFAILDDESGTYDLVAKAIDRSGLRVIRSGSVRSRWVFEDFMEMALYIFDYFGLKPNSEKENYMAKLLGDRQGVEPLHIEDISRFWLLRER